MINKLNFLMLSVLFCQFIDLCACSLRKVSLQKFVEEPPIVTNYFAPELMVKRVATTDPTGQISGEPVVYICQVSRTWRCRASEGVCRCGLNVTCFCEKSLIYLFL